MIIVEPVVETFDATQFMAWPVRIHRNQEFLALCGELEPVDVGTAVAVIVSFNRSVLAPSAGEIDQLSPPQLIQGILQADCLLAPGGLRVRDTAAGLTVNPGCCSGLEDWRDWSQVTEGRYPDLGHDPWPWVEHAGHSIRIWADGGMEGRPPDGIVPIEIAATSLPDLVASAQQQLQDFLELVGPWARPFGTRAAEDLTRALDAHFAVSQPHSCT